MSLCLTFLAFLGFNKGPTDVQKKDMEIHRSSLKNTLKASSKEDAYDAYKVG